MKVLITGLIGAALLGYVLFSPINFLFGILTLKDFLILISTILLGTSISLGIKNWSYLAAIGILLAASEIAFVSLRIAWASTNTFYIAHLFSLLSIALLVVALTRRLQSSAY